MKTAKLLSTFIQNQTKDRNTTCSLLFPTRERIRIIFRLAWPECSHHQLHQFASLLTNDRGHGKCSLRQLMNYLYDEQKEVVVGKGDDDDDDDDDEKEKEKGEGEREGEREGEGEGEEKETSSQGRKTRSDVAAVAVGAPRRHTTAQEALDGCLTSLVHIKKTGKRTVAHITHFIFCFSRSILF